MNDCAMMHIYCIKRLLYFFFIQFVSSPLSSPLSFFEKGTSSCARSTFARDYARVRHIRMWPLALRLPVEVVKIIEKHLHAMCIQTRFIRWWLYSHARRKEWKALRARLGRSRVEVLCPYTHVRMEWRAEMASWLGTTENTQELIVNEAREGLWGRESARLKSAAS